MATKKRASKKTTTKTKVAKKKVAKPQSKYGALRELFARRGSKHSIDEIVKKTGFDRGNAMCAISILKNEKRTAKPIHIERNADGLYVRK